MKLQLMAAGLLWLSGCSSATCPSGRVGDTGACREEPASSTRQSGVIGSGVRDDADAGARATPE